MNKRLLCFILLIVLLAAGSGCGNQEDFSVVGLWECLEPMSEEQLKMYEDYPKDYRSVAAYYVRYQISDDGTFTVTTVLADKDGNTFKDPPDGNTGISFNTSNEASGTWEYDEEENLLTFINMTEGNEPYMIKIFSTDITNADTFRIRLLKINDSTIDEELMQWYILIKEDEV